MPSSSTSLALLFLTITIATAAAKKFLVGNDVGWRVPASNETELYDVWASRRRFHIGDSLRFRYTNDSVLMTVDWRFYRCDTTQPFSTFNDGNTVINLDKAGQYYFISGKQDRCKKGQKMIVEVKEAHQSPSSIATPPVMSLAPSPSQILTSGASSDSCPSVTVSVVPYIVAVAGLWLSMHVAPIGPVMVNIGYFL